MYIYLYVVLLYSQFYIYVMSLIHDQYIFIRESYKPNLEHLSFLVDTTGGVRATKSLGSEGLN